MKLEIKQVGKYGDRDTKSDYGAYTMHPMSSRSYMIGRGLDGKFRTGFEDKPERREALEKLLSKDLSPLSDFWTEYRLLFRLPDGSMRLDTDRPQDEIFVTVAQANYLLAPDENTLKTDHKYKSNTIFYIYNQEAEEKRVAQLQEIKDEVAGIIFSMRGNKEKLTFVTYALGLFASDTLSAENLYSNLTKYKENLKTLKHFEELKDTLKLPNTELQAIYYAKKGLATGLITYDSSVKKYTFQGKVIGTVENDIAKYFKEKKNESDLAALIAEVQASRE